MISIGTNAFRRVCGGWSRPLRCTNSVSIFVAFDFGPWSSPRRALYGRHVVDAVVVTVRTLSWREMRHTSYTRRHATTRFRVGFWWRSLARQGPKVERFRGRRRHCRQLYPHFRFARYDGLGNAFSLLSNYVTLQ